ncbi:unnamed protein product [Bursaphelenchus xylophilus]|uniref:(pine wood nematode) hypothetical protein n=1 Tax=Bursaphelenchus xylophilus TaxID=6326 RepID=A0A1I7RVB5_BURXY|nr:unnamed protein product [Bursaphelenchus xylophilus]CAG9086641.1 unnamed protein product [Bursaphelenchus xylophilus]
MKSAAKAIFIFTTLLVCCNSDGVSNGEFSLYIGRSNYYVRKGDEKYQGPDKFKPSVKELTPGYTGPAVFYAFEEGGKAKAIDYINNKVTEKDPSDSRKLQDWAREVAPFE